MGGKAFWRRSGGQLHGKRSARQQLYGVSSGLIVNAHAQQQPICAPGRDLLPGPTLRAHVGDMVEIAFLNRVNTSNFPNTLDQGEQGKSGPCDVSTATRTNNPDQTRQIPLVRATPIRRNRPCGSRARRSRRPTCGGTSSRFRRLARTRCRRRSARSSTKCPADIKDFTACTNGTCTVTIPSHFKERSNYVDFTGQYVLHCHILAHEDRGMMELVQVIPPLPTQLDHH